MKLITKMGILGACSMAFFAAGCAVGVESETESVGQTEQALSVSAKPKLPFDRGAVLQSTARYGAATTVSVVSGNALFETISDLGENCKLTAETTGATTETDPVMAIIINNGNGQPWGGPAQPCHHGYPYNHTDGYNTLAYNDDNSGRNPQVSWKNANGGPALSVQLVGFLYPTIPFTTATLPVHYTVTECNDASQNRDITLQQSFTAKGVRQSLPGNVVTVAGAAPACSDPVLYELDSRAPQNGTDNGGDYGAARCNDDCASGGTNQSCISGNSDVYMWYFSAGFYSSGNLDIHN